MSALYGLLITKDDDEIFECWCRDQLDLYDAVVCLDGSASGVTAAAARQFAPRLIYLHERDTVVPSTTDHGLRRVAHQEIVKRFGHGGWVMCCHVDEFCYHDPRAAVARAEDEGCDLVSWYSPHFYPHPTELNTTAADRRPIPLRFRHYHWSRYGNGQPWIEDRAYRSAPAVEWDDRTHGSVRPHGVERPAPFHPILLHYKVVKTDPASYESHSDSSQYRHHWNGIADRTGVPFPVRRAEDLYVSRVDRYDRCSRFDGTFPQDWNIGDRYRANTPLLCALRERPVPRHASGGVLYATSGSSAAHRVLGEAFVPDAVVQVDADSAPPPAPAAFDVVVCDGWGATPDPARLVDRIRSWVKPEGRLIAAFSNVARKEVVEGLLAGRWRGAASGEAIRFYTRREFEKLLFRGGFAAHAWTPGSAAATPEETSDRMAEGYIVEARPVPRTDYGLTSIVLVTHNQLAYTRQCLDSIRRFTDRPVELIVVDNASTDGTREYLQAAAGLRCIANASNRGFPAACNQGLAVARGRNLLLLNNDTLVTTGWLERMLSALHADPAIGLVGPTSNRVSGPQCIRADYDDACGLDGFAWEWGKAHHGEIEDVDRLVGFCLLMRRELLDRIGGLDERFGVGMYEDDDFTLRTIVSGYRAVIAVDAFVHHFSSQTFSRSEIDVTGLLETNRRLFQEKWRGKEVGPAPSPATAPLLSLCMIVRDNERTLDAALASARPWVDELIVVDTGSIDRTPEIARAHGATLVEFPWCDDFSAARNESLRHATGQWIFWMDSDDVLPAACGRRLREAISAQPAAGVLGFVMQVHCPGGERGHEVTVVDHVKVVRNRPELRFEGRIHEQILPSIRRLGGDVSWLEAHVVHEGAGRTVSGREAKLARDLRLLKLDLAERPDHPFVLFNLGMTLADAKRHDEAVRALTRCIDVSDPSESHLRKAYALLAEALQGQQEPRAAQKCCWEGLGRFPADPELLFRSGVLAMQEGRWPQAAEAFRAILSTPRQRYFSSLDVGILGHKAMANLASVYEQMNDQAAAESFWRQALEAAPRSRDAFDGLVSHLVGRELLDEAEREAGARLTDPELRPAALVASARVSKRRGRHHEAARAFQEALESAPDDRLGWQEYARHLFEWGPESEAEQCLRTLIALDPADASAHHNLGQIQLRQHRPREAAEAFVASLALRPNHAPTLRQLGRALTLAGDAGAARQSWRTLLETAPADQEAAAALQLHAKGD